MGWTKKDLQKNVPSSKERRVGRIGDIETMSFGLYEEQCRGYDETAEGGGEGGGYGRKGEGEETERKRVP